MILKWEKNELDLTWPDLSLEQMNDNMGQERIGQGGLRWAVLVETSISRAPLYKRWRDFSSGVTSLASGYIQRPARCCSLKVLLLDFVCWNWEKEKKKNLRFSFFSLLYSIFLLRLLNQLSLAYINVCDSECIYIYIFFVFSLYFVMSFIFSIVFPIPIPLPLLSYNFSSVIQRRHHLPLRRFRCCREDMCGQCWWWWCWPWRRPLQPTTSILY